MNIPQMPTELQNVVKDCFQQKDVEGIVYFNRIWWERVKGLREEQRKEYEERLKQSEGEYN